MTLLEVHGFAPFNTIYVNPTEDPTRRAAVSKRS
jgi:hypothetical protein